jgi:hypothetical protein
MERAKTHEVGAAFLELHVLAHDVDHIDAGQQLLDERLGDGHRGIFADVWAGLGLAVSPQARPSMCSWTTVDRFVPRDDADPVIASEARQSTRSWTTVDGFVPRDDADPVIAREARQSMDRFVIGDHHCSASKGASALPTMKPISQETP